MNAELDEYILGLVTESVWSSLTMARGKAIQFDMSRKTTNNSHNNNLLLLLLLLFVFFTPVLADGFSLDFEWQQVSSSSQDSSQYSSRFQQYCCLDDLHSSSYFQVLRSLYQSFGNCTKNTNYNWYKCHFHVLQFFFPFPSKVQVLILLFGFFDHVFSHQCVFHSSLSDSKSPQVSRAPLSTLADLNNAMLWIVLFLHLISNSFRLFSKPFGIVPNAPTTAGTTVIVHFSQISGKIQVFVYLFAFFHFHFLMSFSWLLLSSLLLLLSIVCVFKAVVAAAFTGVQVTSSLLMFQGRF